MDFLSLSLSLSLSLQITCEQKGKKKFYEYHMCIKKIAAKTTEKDLLEWMLNSWKHEVNTILIPIFYPNTYQLLRGGNDASI